MCVWHAVCGTVRTKTAHVSAPVQDAGFDTTGSNQELLCVLPKAC
jgi:hypothetical protein